MIKERLNLFVDGKLNAKLVENKVRELIAVHLLKTDSEVAGELRDWIQSYGLWLNFVRCESVKTDQGWRYRVTIGKRYVDLPIDIVDSLKINREW